MSELRVASAQTKRAKLPRLSPEISEFLSIMSALEHQSQDKPDTTAKQG